jgi:hypothetical protein
MFCSRRRKINFEGVAGLSGKIKNRRHIHLMTRKVTIIFFVATIFVACCLLDVYDVSPRFKWLLGFIEIACCMFLFYSSRKRTSDKPEALGNLRKLHAKAVNFLARAFGVMAIINGVIFTIWGCSLVLDAKATIDVDGAPSVAGQDKPALLRIEDGLRKVKPAKDTLVDAAKIRAQCKREVSMEDILKRTEAPH